MCCRTSVYPLDYETAAAVLEIGRFRPSTGRVDNANRPVSWERLISEEGTIVTASINADSLELNLSPAISVYSHHHGKRIAASVYFEIAAKYAEKVAGDVIQRATVVGCKTGEASQTQLLVARYPSMPLSFERVCPGFQDVLLNSAIEEALYDSLHDLMHDASSHQQPDGEIEAA